MKQLTLILLFVSLYSCAQQKTCEEFYATTNKFIKSSEIVLTKEYGENPYEGFINNLRSTTSAKEYLYEFEKLYEIDSILRAEINENSEVYNKVFIVNDSEGLTIPYVDFNSITTILKQCVAHDTITTSYIDVVSACGALCPSLVYGTMYWEIDKTSDSRDKFLVLSHVAILANGQIRETLRNKK